MHSAAQASASGHAACCELAVRRLLGDRQRVVDGGRHAGGLERGAGRGTIGAAKHGEMVGVVGVVGLPAQARCTPSVAPTIARRRSTSAVEIRQRQPQPGRLELRHPEVLRDDFVHVLGGHAVNAEDAHSFGEIGVGR